MEELMVMKTILMALLMLVIISSPFTSSIMSLWLTVLMTSAYMVLCINFYKGFPLAMIMFLIYISGLMVVFTYFLALSPNPFQTTSSWMPLLVTLIMVVMMMTSSKNEQSFFLNPEVYTSYWETLSSIFSSPFFTLYVAMTLILLIALLAVVSMCFKSPKPMRSSTKMK